MDKISKTYRISRRHLQMIDEIKSMGWWGLTATDIVQMGIEELHEKFLKDEYHLGK